MCIRDRTTDVLFTESDAHADDFLGRLCFHLEETAKKFETIGARVCSIRTAAVLSPNGGMLKELIPLAKKNILSPIGTGNQIVPWIHIDDIVRLYTHLLENENMKGPFNAAATENPTNREFSQALAASLHKKMILPAVPAFVLKIAVGEMSGILLEGSTVSNAKIKNGGFVFQFDQLNSALKNLLPTKNR